MSSTAQSTSNPWLTNGQATGEGTPAFSPAMIDSCGPGTSVIRPARTDSSMQAAALGSTPTSRQRPARCRAAAAARAPTPIGTTVTSGAAPPACASTSSKIVA